MVEEAVLPRYMKQHDSAMDLVAVSKYFDEKGNVVYGTGLAFEIPVGYVGFIFPRSSNADKDLILTNSVGIIDPGYRGEVKLKYKPSGFFATAPVDDSEGNISDSFDYVCFGKEDIDDVDNVAVYSIGDRIGQILIMERPLIEWEEVVELSMNTERGTGGYGSTNTGMTSFEGPHKL